MYSYIKGQLVEIIDNELIVLEAGQIGYNVRIPAQVIDYLPGIGEMVKIYTYLHVREDAFELFGFLTRDDLEMFKKLLGVSGIGPKGALGILSILSADDLRFAILSDDAKSIAKAPGVGNKTAQRVIIELKDKVSLEDAFENKLAHSVDKTGRTEQNVKKSEAIEALVALGYSAADATKALLQVEISDEDTVETILKQALKSMAFM